MSLQEHTTPDKLERYSLIWSLIRLPVAAVALFLGGQPAAYMIFGFTSTVSSLLGLAWIISGVAAVYLGYLWYKEGWQLFGGEDMKDRLAFAVMVVSGLNLGFAGISYNIGMSIASGQVIFAITGLIYLLAAWHLYTRWNQNNQQLF